MKKKISVLMLVSAVLSIVFFTSIPGRTLLDGGLLPPMDCVSAEGQLIRFAKVTPEQLWKFGGAVAYATIDPAGNPFIFIDGENFHRLPPQTQRFFHAHECAHHKLHPFEHISNPTVKFGVSDESTTEKEADCHSVKTIVNRFGYESDDINIITESLMNQELMNHFITRDGKFMLKFNPQIALAHRRTVPQRVEDIKTCYLTLL